MTDFEKDAKWYIIHTYSGYENKVKTNLEKIIENRGLQNLIGDVKIPMETVVEADNGEEKTKEMKMFPCYVLVKMIMTDDTWHVVRNVSGVTGFVGPGSRPIPMSDDEVAALGVETTVSELSFTAGDSVKIKDGPMAGFPGKVAEISPDKKKAKVTVSVFGRETPVELDCSVLEKAEF